MIKVGLAGCGRISRKHVESFIELSENIALTHVCDVKNDRAERLAKEYSETGKRSRIFAIAMSLTHGSQRDY